MEPKESQDDSTGAKLTRGHILEKLDLVAAPSRAPKKVIAKAYDLTSIELFMLGDLPVPWARIEGDAKEESLTTKMLENFLKAVFKRWDSTNGAPNIPEKPAARNKREMSVQVGRRKQEGFDEPLIKEAKARKLGASAWLAVSTKHPEVVKFDFRDDNQRMVSQNKVKINYHPDTTYESAQIQSMRIFDQAEAARAEGFDKRLLIALARNRIVALAKNGNDPGNSPSPLIAADHQLGKRLFEPKLSGPQLLEQTRKQLRLVRGYYGDNYMGLLQHSNLFGLTF
ncbi:hypothetical protein NW755_003849 [Fusarium falciforme]|uniref:Uncharacterized protein n=1 Tax=Fusarium falciforme TaxID=195108 RepID=A0A9W8RBM3_9HYPO|nr:hypothetical protein NW755_003849 [Fusarium falciforme]KAJ4250476.1 hypothetical protein NW757_007308 [Fusarium falciforme]